MRIIRVGQVYEVMQGSKLLYKGGSFEDARNWMADNGVKDANGELSGGHVSLDGTYDRIAAEEIKRDYDDAIRRYRSLIKLDKYRKKDQEKQSKKRRGVDTKKS